MHVHVHGGLGRLEKKGRMSSVVAEEVCGISSRVPTVCVWNRVEPGSSGIRLELSGDSSPLSSRPKAAGEQRC